MFVTRQDHNRVWFLVCVYRDGTATEKPYPDKTAAEAALWLIPQAQIWGQQTDVQRAYLRPSVLTQQ